MKKLIPALCMLLVAAALMGTSTYAWFTMNTDVDVTGMNVTAATPSSLYISKDSNMANKKFDETAANATAALLPSSAALPSGTTLAPSWYTGTAATAGTATVSGNYSEAGSAPTGKAYYLANTFYVMSEESDFDKLALHSLSVSHTNDTDKDLMEALRVMIVASKDGTVLHSVAYAVTAGDEPGTVVTGVSTTESITFYSFTNGDATGNAAKQVLIDKMTADEIYQLDVYVYLDGEDGACTSDNRNDLTVTNTAIALNFAKAAE